MTQNLLRRTLYALLLVTFGGVNAAGASYAVAPGSWSPAEPADDEPADEVRVAQGGCSAAAAQAAAQSGGQVLSVQTAERGGQTVCIVTVLVPARDGERPRRQTITIAQ